MITGVDISGHQGPEWQPRDEDQFVFVKATEGSTYASADAAAQLSTARAAGLQAGHYHFMVPGNPERQAAWFVDKADIQAGDLLACDWETHEEGHPSVDDAARFIAEVKRLKPGHRTGLYCNKADWLGSKVKPGDFLWIAHYTTAAEPGIASTWHLWQHTNKPLDQNKGHFDSLDSLQAWARGERYSIPYQSIYVELGPGRYVTPIDKAILLACARASGWGTVRLSQGGLSTSVTDSALTHAGLGAGDIAPDGRSKEAVWAYAGALIRSGIVAFPRGFGGDPWTNQKHIHFGSLESYDHAHAQLQAQIDEFRIGGDGLKGDGSYNGPNVKLDRWQNSPYNLENIKPDTRKYVVDTDVLYGRNVDGAIVRRRVRGYEIQAVCQIKRFDRWNVVTSSPTYYAEQFLTPAA